MALGFPILRNDGWTPRKISILDRFANDMKDGDLVVLRLGTSTILGVGFIVGDYRWSHLFSDIDGWELQHYRRVKLVWKRIRKFNMYAVKWGDTTQKLNSNRL